MHKPGIEEIGLVILNYMTSSETIEMLESVWAYYPGLRILVVDNGSTENVIRQLQEAVQHYPTVTLLSGPENLGFAKGNNAGIEVLREEGFEYIVCSNNDVLFAIAGVLEVMKSACIEYEAAVVGPRIINAAGQDQNPYQHVRPTEAEARKNYLRSCWLPDAAFPALKVWRYLRSLVQNEKKYLEVADYERPSSVYGLHGSFIMFCPRFFAHYKGFDDRTFLYGEELIIAEMLYCRSLRALFVPGTYVIHKEDATSDFVWKSKTEKMKTYYRKRSIRHWYQNHYLKNSP